MLKAAIFDLDGLMIDSEPLWREIESAVFTARGAPVSINDCAQTMGLRIDEVIRYWQLRFPHASLEIAETQRQIINGLIKLIEEKAEPMPGILKAIDLVRAVGLKIAIASSSSMKIIEAALRRFRLENIFDVICSAEDEIRGKPAPDVYNSVINRLGIQPNTGLAFEDSLNGIKSAKAAGLLCICVPDRLADHSKLPADLILPSLENLSIEVITSLVKLPAKK